jgi:uncharacterized protein Smg (DUF494 family)
MKSENMYPERIIEIIVRLLAIIHESKQIVNEDLENLGKLGYSQNEINRAFQWLYKNFIPKEKYSEKSYKSESHRVFHEAEKKVISSEGRGFLIQLTNLGLVSNVELEIILERLMMTGLQRITLNDVKLFSSNFLLEKFGSSFTSINIIDTGDKIN